MMGDSKKSGTWGPVRPGPDTMRSVRDVRGRLRETGSLIESLRTDLEYYRTRNGEIVRERDDLRRQLSRRESHAGNQERLQGDIRLVKNESDRLREALSRTMDENHELANRCSRLETTLEREREKHAETLEVLVCLEGQIEQLESMVKMLLEHKRLADSTDE